MSEINFISTAKQADVIELGLAFVTIGTTSVTFRCEVRNIFTKKTIISIDKIVFVNVDESGHPIPLHQTIQHLQKRANNISFKKK